MEGSYSSKEMKIAFSVLVVDDCPTTRNIHSTMLRSLGLKNIGVAENGKEAVDLFRAGANFNIVFMDMDMPILNGIEATKELRHMGVKSKIVCVTSSDSETERQNLMQAGVDICHAKPLNVAKILPLLEEIKKN